MQRCDIQNASGIGCTGNKIRNSLQEHRGEYFIEYHCATSGTKLAFLSVVFPRNAADFSYVRKTMERELEIWLRRYPVPIMAHGIDEKEDAISVSTDFGESTLMGYIEPGSGKIIRKWGLFKDRETPSEQVQEDYLENVYRDVPFRLADDVRKKATDERCNFVRVAKILIFFIVVVPVLIQIVALRIDWIGNALAIVSILIGLFKAAKAFGYVKPSASDEAKAREELNMKHHHYHCEKNPKAFARLKVENFEREALERIRQEDANLRLATKPTKEGSVVS